MVAASGTIDRWLAGTLTLGNGKPITGWSAFPARATVRNVPLVYNETLLECSSTELAQAPEGSIIICDATTGSTDFFRAMRNLPSSNVRAAIIIADDPRIFRSNLFPFPGVVITPTQGRELISYASNRSEPRASIDLQQTILGKEPRTAPALSEDSSRCPAVSYEDILKPDLMAPGVSILAAQYPHTTGPRIGNKIYFVH